MRVIMDFLLRLICINSEKQLLKERTLELIKKDQIALKAANMIRDDYGVQEETLIELDPVIDVGVKVRTKTIDIFTIVRFISKIRNKKGEDEDGNSFRI